MNPSTDSPQRTVARARHAGADAIDHLLGAQRTRIRRRFVLHGAGWVIAACAAAVVVYFGLDLVLQLPRAVRIVVSLGVLTYLGFGIRRRVLYPLQRSFGQQDVAIAFERRFPELHERLISAYQLEVAARSDADRRDQSDAMISRVVADAAESIRDLPTASLLDPRRTARVWAVAGVALVAGLGAAALKPTEFGVFVQRALGADVDYPRRTSLFIELPTDEPGVLVERGEGRADVTMAAGGDLPVLVRAEGVLPREAQLVIQGGRGLPAAVTMAQRPGERFRHVFRRVQAPFMFHARGGDDPNGDLQVFVRTVEPPLVGTIEAVLTYPAYTGQPPARVVGGAIEALVGTQVELTVTTTTPVERAELRFLDSAAELELRPLQVEDDSGAGRAFGGSFVVAQTDRYEIQLENRDGLGNPRPGAYPVLALEDHPPTGRVLLPASDDVTVVLPDALLPVRVEARDDFGLSNVLVVASTGRSEAAERLSLLAPPAANADGSPTPLPRETVLTELLDVAALEPGEGPRQGDTISVILQIEDNRQPEHGQTEFPRRQVHVVDEIELARRVSTHFRRIRDQVDKSLAQQTAQLDAADALLEVLPETGAGRDPRLVQLQVGQVSVHAACRRSREDLMRAYDLHLFNGLEGADSVNAPKVRSLYLRVLREDPSADALVPAFYRAVATAQQTGTIGPMENALDPILAMTMRADRLVEQLGAQVNDILDAAGVAASSGELRAALSEARTIQAAMVAELEALLAQLQEWNEYQDVVQSVRALRDAQRDVEFRTRAIHDR